MDQTKLLRKIILVESDTAKRALFSQNLELYTGSEIIYMNSADEVTDFLKENGKVDLVVSENMAGDEYTILKIYYYIHSQSLKIPIILMGTNSKVSESVVMVENDDWKKLVKEAGKLLVVTAEHMMELKVPQFYPIPIQSFGEISSLPMEILIRKNEEYIPLIAPKSEILKNKLDELVIQGVTHLFIDSSKRLAFSNIFSKCLEDTLQKNDLTPSDRIAVTSTAFDTASLLLQEVGMTPESISASRETIESMTRIASETRELDNLLNIIKRDNESYLYKHSLIISIISHQIISHMEWGNKDQKNKICFAAFFHDVTIGDDKLAMINWR